MTCKVVTPDVDDFVKRSLIAQLDWDRREAGRYQCLVLTIICGLRLTAALEQCSSIIWYSYNVERTQHNTVDISSYQHHYKDTAPVIQPWPRPRCWLGVELLPVPVAGCGPVPAPVQAVGELQSHGRRPRVRGAGGRVVRVRGQSVVVTITCTVGNIN